MIRFVVVLGMAFFLVTALFPFAVIAQEEAAEEEVIEEADDEEVEIEFPLETTIDLTYTYTQIHAGERVSADTQVQQKYELKYEAPLTSIFDLLMEVKVDVDQIFDQDKADTSKVTTTIELGVSGPQARAKTSWDNTISTTEAFEEEGESTNYENTYTAEVEFDPDYLPDAKLKLERIRTFEALRTERTDDKLEIDLREQIGDLKLEFDLDFDATDAILPRWAGKDDVEWIGKTAYQSKKWWGIEVDLTYEIKESYSEEYAHGKFDDEDKSYTQKFQTTVAKSLDLTPLLEVSMEYEYTYEQDLILADLDYSRTQTLTFSLEYSVFHWLDFDAEVSRESEDVYNIAPLEPEETVKDAVELSFKAKLIEWLELTGKAEWKFEDLIEGESGGTVQDTDDEIYELSVKNKLGDWWDLTVTGSSEYERVEGWLTKKEGKVKAAMSFSFFRDFTLEPTYEIKRTVNYDEFEPLDLNQQRSRELSLKFSYASNFTQFIDVTFTNEFTLEWDEEVDEVLNLEETLELSEDTVIKVALVELIRAMKLEGEISRKAEDIRDDDEPMLVDITYALTLDWTVQEVEISKFDVSVSFKYDDNGDTFDKSTFNPEVAWTMENIDVLLEYEYVKTYSEDIDEERTLNLEMNVLF